MVFFPKLYVLLCSSVLFCTDALSLHPLDGITSFYTEAGRRFLQTLHQLVLDCCLSVGPLISKRLASLFAPESRKQHYSFLEVNQTRGGHLAWVGRYLLTHAFWNSAEDIQSELK